TGRLDRSLGDVRTPGRHRRLGAHRPRDAGGTARRPYAGDPGTVRGEEEAVGWVERKRNPSQWRNRGEMMGFAEPVIGPRFARTRWLNPSYKRASRMARLPYLDRADLAPEFQDLLAR